MKRKKTDRLKDDFDIARYFSYKEHRVCFACRKMFNQTRWVDRLTMRKDYSCPQCSAPMIDLGRDFKPPRQSNIKQWRKVELLARRGYDWTHYLREQNVEGDKRFWWTGVRGPKARTLREAKADYPPIE